MAAIDIQLHGPATVSLRHRRDRSGHFACRPEQVVDQRVDGTFHVGQEPLARPNLTRWRVFPSRPTTWPTRSKLLRHPLIGGDDFIESIGDLASTPK